MSSIGPLRLASNELRRLSTGVLPKLALVALVLVPLLYASLYLFANYDPYSRLDKLPAAIVNGDQGAKDTEGHQRNIGAEVSKKVVDSKSFAWRETSAADAANGVREGDYAFSVTVPRGFSSALLSPGRFEPQQATLRVVTNDANNYLAGTIADQVADQIRDGIAEQVGEQAADRFMIGFGKIYDSVDKAAKGADKLSSGSADLLTGQRKLATGANDLASGASKLDSGLGTLDTKVKPLPGKTRELADGTTKLSDGLDTLDTKVKPLPGKTRELADGAKQVADGNKQVAAKGQQVASRSAALQKALDDANGQLADRLRDRGLSESEVKAVMAELGKVRQPVDKADKRIQGTSNQLDKLSNGSQKVAAGAEKLADSAPALRNGVHNAASGAEKVDDGANKLADSAPALRDGVHKAATGADKVNSGAAKLSNGEKDAVAGTKKLDDGAGKLAGGLEDGRKQIPNPDDPTRSKTADTIADPVAIDSQGLAKANTYGAGLAPFFLALATWVGAFVLFLLLRPLSARALTAGARPLAVAFGGWLPAALLGAAQMVVLFAAVTMLVGIEVAHPVAAVGFLLLGSACFTAIVHALNAFFGSVGKFIALVLLVLQLVTAGGTFPWQTIPDVLYPVHQAMPMSYLVDGLRHLLYAGASTSVWIDVAVLAGYTVGSLALATLAARRQRTWTPSRLQPELSL